LVQTKYLSNFILKKKNKNKTKQKNTTKNKTTTTKNKLESSENWIFDQVRTRSSFQIYQLLFIGEEVLRGVEEYTVEVEVLPI
jgi:hypothetical protein